MALAAAGVGAAAACAHSLWSYNRTNYFFDREMRQNAEFKLMQFRQTQAKQWREDVRDMVALTERKMDNYLVVNALLLGLDMMLFCEGRLVSGAPTWLLHMYLLNLGGSFVFMILATWFSMHASIVAQSVEARTLTQFVRVPVPTWDQVQSARTYGMSFEAMHLSQMFRVPFTRASHPTSSKGVARSDPWALEQLGDHRQELYELQEMPAANRRHVSLARKAAKRYQTFDAFARAAMLFGVVHMLISLAYYAIGYGGVQHYSPLAAFCGVALMLGGAGILLHVDLSLTLKEELVGMGLLVAGPAASCGALIAWSLDHEVLQVVLPFSFAGHALFLLWALSSLGLEMTPGGAVLPLKLRAVLYLDVFKWHTQHSSSWRRGGSVEEELEEGEVRGLGRRLSKRLLGGNVSRRVSNILDNRKYAPRSAWKGPACGASGQVTDVPHNAFEPDTDCHAFHRQESTTESSASDAVELRKSFKLPYRIFSLATIFLAALWAIGFFKALCYFFVLGGGIQHLKFHSL